MKKGTISLIIGLLLIAAALSLTGYNLWTNYRAGIEAREALELVSAQITDNPVPNEGRSTRGESGLSEADIEYPDYVLNPNMDMPTQTINGNDYIGTLNLPTLEIELPVMAEWDYDKLNVAPCRYAGTAYLNNMVICAHNFAVHFGQIGSLHYGDQVIFTDMDGNVFSYSVKEIETLQPEAIEKMTTGEWDLTLFTCTLGGATRVTVRCEKLSPASGTTEIKNP